MLLPVDQPTLKACFSVCYLLLSDVRKKQKCLTKADTAILSGQKFCPAESLVAAEQLMKYCEVIRNYCAELSKSQLEIS